VDCVGWRLGLGGGTETDDLSVLDQQGLVGEQFSGFDVEYARGVDRDSRGVLLRGQSAGGAEDGSNDDSRCN
jgi:hypothetical protein